MTAVALMALTQSWSPASGEPPVGTPTPTGAPAQPLAPPVSPPLSTGCAPPSTEIVRTMPWAQRRLGAAGVWNLTRGAGVTVAVIDTGVDAAVPQLAGRVLAGTDVTGQRVPANTDCSGHGTFVAGIIAAAPVPGTPVAGMAPEATVLPIRQASRDSDGTAAGLAAGIRAAVDGRASVINISTSAFFPDDSLHAAIRYATERDVLIVAAVANQAENGNPRTYPAAYPEVLAVGATGQNGQPAGFSEAGDYVDVAAPGEGVISLGTGGSGHLVGDGTSYAAPEVAGVAALVRAYRPELSAAAVRRRIELTADRPGGRLPDPQLGWGVLNPVSAVTAELPGETAGPASPSTATGAVRNVMLPPVRPNHAPRGITLIFTAAALSVALVGVAGIRVARAGLRRQWRPGTGEEALAELSRRRRHPA
ncbi:type VII secretion-associated serine protease mycosin [Frankia sp. Cj3]|uniref:type VII secretion-associated serine protease mycosin n=3 Tax=unclassified Frankia TaxID=2632575 RepID=UPI001EF583E6|nr:type VII secretion-associated serine protease mycosin [Frankia sp. Cj3]